MRFALYLLGIIGIAAVFAQASGEAQIFLFFVLLALIIAILRETGGSN